MPKRKEVATWVRCHGEDTVSRRNGVKNGQESLYERMGSDISKPFADEYVKKKGGVFDYKGLTKAEMQNSINSFRLQFMSSEDCAARHKGRWENLLVRCFPGKELSRNIRSFKGD